MKTTSSNVLKKCPHCNGVAFLNSNYSYKTRSYFVFVKCDVCGAQGKVVYSAKDPTTENWQSAACDSAVEAWNLRAGNYDEDDYDEV